MLCPPTAFDAHIKAKSVGPRRLMHTSTVFDAHWRGVRCTRHGIRCTRITASDPSNRGMRCTSHFDLKDNTRALSNCYGKTAKALIFYNHSFNLRPLRFLMFSPCIKHRADPHSYQANTSLCGKVAGLSSRQEANRTLQTASTVLRLSREGSFLRRLCTDTSKVFSSGSLLEAARRKNGERQISGQTPHGGVPDR